MITKDAAYFNKITVMALATVDENGIPNVSAIASKKIVDESTIWTVCLSGSEPESAQSFLTGL